MAGIGNYFAIVSAICGGGVFTSLLTGRREVAPFFLRETLNYYNTGCGGVKIIPFFELTNSKHGVLLGRSQQNIFKGEAMKKAKIEVKKQSPRTWGVYVNGELNEGGFFDVYHANRVADELELTINRKFQDHFGVEDMPQ
jgi:hypothetical protein